MAMTFHIDIVSAEDSIFSGRAQALFAKGELGELGVYPGHTPLLTTLKPGQLRVLLQDGSELNLYVSGGILEVQPETVSVLADVASKAEDLDEAAALEAQQRAEKILEEQQSGMEYSQALAELAQAAAQLEIIRRRRK